MLNQIHYEEKRFIIVNDIQNTLFYFFDFDTRSNSKNMEFEHFHSYYEIHILLSPHALHFIEGMPYPIQANDFVLLPPSLLHKTGYPEGVPSRRLVITFMYKSDGYGFQDAYEAFDAVLELNPQSVYTNFARAIALYYGKRPQLALQDIEVFYQADRNDPYRMLWYYLIERETSDYAAALLHLKQRYAAAVKREDYFGYHIIDYLTGLTTKEQLLFMVKDPQVPMYLKIERACEVYFYLGKEAQRLNEPKLAFDYFHLCARTDKYDFLEYRYALFEIRRMARAHQLAAYRDRNPLRGEEFL